MYAREIDEKMRGGSGEATTLLPSRLFGISLDHYDSAYGCWEPDESFFSS